MTASNIPRMRGITEAAEEIRAADPNTAISAYLLRKLVKANKIPSVKVGVKYLVNMDIVSEYFSKGDNTEPVPDTYGTIRRIDERIKYSRRKDML